MEKENILPAVSRGQVEQKFIKENQLGIYTLTMTGPKASWQEEKKDPIVLDARRLV
jgi:hypothetical protein